MRAYSFLCNGPAVIHMSRFVRVSVTVACLLIGAVLCAYWAERYMKMRTLHSLAEQGSSQLKLYASSLHNLIDRYRIMPLVLSSDPDFKVALSAPLTPAVQQHLNLKLERLNELTHSSTLEVMNSEGLAVAASNWRLPTSYVGHNYHFRPYFRQARAQGSGRFYGVGVVSGVPGYFLSQAIRSDTGQFLGVVVVKLEFPDLEDNWSQSPDILLVTDARGVVFIANQSPWRYRMLRPLTDQDRTELEEVRQYYNRPLSLLEHQVQQVLGEGQHRVKVQGMSPVEDYLWSSLPLPAEGWTLHLLRPNTGWEDQARTAALAAAGIWLALGFAILLLLQRRRLAFERRRRAEELEALVEARTLELRTAQDGLVQATKLAALGQMSAALAHELNQPLTAQRMQLASLRLLLDQNRLEDAQHILSKLEGMLGRMAALTAHLKTYARQTPTGLREVVDVSVVMGRALEPLEPRLREMPVEIHQHGLSLALVWGDSIRIEQVLVNLLRNALDALNESAEQRLDLRAEPHGNFWHILIVDTGSGIAQEHLSQVFDPFFTTKPVGEGLGLGLAVSCAIVKDLGGELTAENTEQGTCFRLILPAASPHEVTHD